MDAIDTVAPADYRIEYVSGPHQVPHTHSWSISLYAAQGDNGESKGAVVTLQFDSRDDAHIAYLALLQLLDRCRVEIHPKEP